MPGPEHHLAVAGGRGCPRVVHRRCHPRDFAICRLLIRPGMTDAAAALSPFGRLADSVGGTQAIADADRRSTRAWWSARGPCPDHRTQEGVVRRGATLLRVLRQAPHPGMPTLPLSISLASPKVDFGPATRSVVGSRGCGGLRPSPGGTRDQMARRGGASQRDAADWPMVLAACRTSLTGRIGIEAGRRPFLDLCPAVGVTLGRDRDP